VLWWGFVAFARRVAPENRGRRMAILVLALGFASPIGWLSLPETHWVAEMQIAMSDANAAIQPWFAFHTAIAIGLMPLVLLGCTRLLDGDRATRSLRSRTMIATAAGGALVSWLHSWQGATLTLIIVGVPLVRWPRRRDLVLVPIALACIAPIAYQFALSKLDPAWKLAVSLNNRPDLVVTTPQLAVLGPLLAAAVFGRCPPTPAR
jgi:hypothetical protein